MIMTMTTVMLMTMTTMRHDDHYHNDHGDQLASLRKWRLNDQMRAHCRVDRSELEYHESLTQSFTIVGEELLGQLKMV